MWDGVDDAGGRATLSLPDHSRTNRAGRSGRCGQWELRLAGTKTCRAGLLFSWRGWWLAGTATDVDDLGAVASGDGESNSPGLPMVGSLRSV